MEKQFRFNYEHYASLEAMPEADRQLVREAERATANAHAPYSEFRVGAAARLRSGRILYGSNFESEVYPAGLCAERSLMFYAEANYADDPIESLAIASRPSERECYPCGQCRQVMVDVERRQQSPMRVIMSGGGTASVVESAALLLPFTFSLKS
ncbi:MULTISPECIES: cytidine deaminase [unclassified Alistipes]|jgi:cytidine deaminase|uniref:cytidine deaminase n=1 Tax=unclassified Alistipes TaxID=2608932 RepID=UPI000B39D980|nr:MULTISPECIES: cytidine deaminase [unclassified Alistipes]OUO19185.1 cytidine deaminase [Alistipes sp. An31A]HIV32182.1 cytidine deaminase [Candidatus Alistipes excrementigallinarum]